MPGSLWTVRRRRAMTEAPLDLGYDRANMRPKSAFDGSPHNSSSVRQVASAQKW